MALNTALQQVYNDAKAYGLDDMGARVAAAIANTEGGYGGKVGDSGNAVGTFQFHRAGELPGFAASIGKTIEEAFALLQKNPMAGNQYALTGYLGNAIRQGESERLSGAALAEYAQRVGQRSENPAMAAASYNSLFTGLAGGETPGMPEPGRPSGPATAPMPPAKAVEQPAIPNPLPNLAGVTDSLKSVAEQIQGLTSTASATVQNLFATLQWFGQENIYKRAGLIVVGFVFVVIGLLLFALSFIDKESAQKVVETVAVAA